ncbi:hypothetical protein ACJIZ3_008310 [Penstemon smallii]|uniref:Phytocyanin domain-containing protein n=1 Tax=Penstemon smallii TaxID=265156 RepID=A0ABD3T9D7_9LAMI
MAFKAFLIAIITAAAVASAVATDYMVGDNAGWKLEVNYTEWAKGKDFRVGDTLMFMYNKDYHNVAKVNGTDFQQCTASNASNLLRTGSDTITLATPGKKWYICGLSDHCSKGMKLVINVAAAPEAPAPSPTSAATNFSPLKSYAWILAAVLLTIMP